MAEARDTRGRRVKWMRRGARVLAVVWASLATLVIVAFPPLIEAINGFPDNMKPFHLDLWLDRTPLELWLKVGFLVLLLWVTAAVAWRWERIGGILLLLTSLLLLTAYPVAMQAGAVTSAGPYCWPCTVPPALPGVIAAFLFLASWWISKTLQAPQATE